jgi:hypothetical protein
MSNPSISLWVNYIGCLNAIWNPRILWVAYGHIDTCVFKYHGYWALRVRVYSY